MTRHLTSRCASWRSLLLATVVSVAVLPQGRAYQFKLGDVSVDLQEVTTNVDVYFTAMRFNRAADEWDVDVTVSNKSALTISAPLVYLVDSFTGTSGPLRPDGVSTNLSYYDLSGQIPSGVLAPGTVSAARTLGLGFTTNQAPKLAARLFSGIQTNTSQALAFVRSLNQAGQPLPGVSVQETGPGGGATNLTDGVFGVATLGQLPGEYVWQFSQPGYLSVWRQASLQSNSVTVIPYPWLAASSQQTFTISPLLGGTASNQTVAVQFGPGSVSQQAAVQLTALGSQTLPLFLPQGWSPLQAFWLQSSVALRQPVQASLIPWGSISLAENAVLVQFSSAPLGWQALQLAPGNGTNAVSVTLPGGGVYALVVADTAPAAPPAPSVGSLLQPGNAPSANPTNLHAFGTVTPAASPASLAPALVTADADLTVSNVTGSLPSGTLLKGRVQESYLLNDGTTRVPPFYGNSIMGYQRPGQPQLGVVHAHFPMSPVLLFGSDQLNQAVVQADLFPPGPFAGGVVDTNGGVIANAGLRLLVGAGVLASREAVQLFRVSPTNFTSLAGTNFPVVAAFEVAVGTLPPGGELFLQSTGTPPSTTLVLARVRTDQGLYGLEPRKRLQSDLNGNLLSSEPANGDALPGLTGSGEYVLLQVQPQQDLVEGIAKNAAGEPAGGLPVQVAGQPWLTFSAPDGSFKLLAPGGSGSLNVRDLATGDTGSQVINVPTNLTSLSTAVAVVAGGPQVVSVAPSDGSTNVAQVSSVVINFNRPINPATLMSSAVQLLESNLPVVTTLTLNLANTTVTLLPSAPLDPATQFTLMLATNITDTIGRPLRGRSQFSFTTVGLSARDPAAQLIIYAPGATNLATNVVAALPGFVPGTNASLIVVHGTPGCADPGVPVIIENEGSGVTTTVLSQPDGSFTSYVSGQEKDFISATFISLNGARLYVPVNRQLFDDGSVGLYPQGGALEATGDGGPVQVTVPPNAIQTRTKFKLASINAPELQTQLGGIMPSNGIVAGSALNLNIQGSVPTLPLQVSFPVDLGDLGYPTNAAPTNAAAALAVVQTNQEVTSFQIMDQLVFVPESSPSSDVKGKRASGRLHPRPRQGGAAAGALDTSIGLLISSLGPVGMAASIGFNQVLVPMLFGAQPVTIKGQVTSVPYGIAEQVENAGLANQIFNLQLGSLAGNEQVNVPLSLAQQMGIKYVPANIITLVAPGSGGTAGNVVGQFLALTLQALKLQEANMATPLSGAFITVTLTGGGLVQQPGRLYPGMVYATSDARGNFLTVAPAAGANYVTTCTHPLFQEVQTVPVAPISLFPGQQGQLSLAGAVYDDFFFQLPNADQAPPSVNIANTPFQPAAGQPCQLVVNASQPAATPTIGVGITSFTTNNMFTGQGIPNVQCSLANKVTTPGPNNSVQYSATLLCDSPVQVTLKVVVQGQNGNQDAVFNYYVAFTGPQPVKPASNIPPPPPSDKHGPLVLATDPVNNGFAGPDSSVTVHFNKPIDASVTTNLVGITLVPQGGAGGTAPSPILALSQDQQSLALAYPGLLPAATYRLTLSGQSIRDLAGQPLNQLPSASVPASFTMTFRTPPSATATLSPPLANGRGCAINGNFLYALDQAPTDNYLDVYDISTPLKPRLLSQTHLFGQPRDLVVIPQYRYVLNADDKNVKTNDLVAVVGGDLGSLINQNQGTTVTAPGQYLWLLSMADPTSPQVLASPIVSYRDSSVVPKVVWAPPFLVYQECGADIQQLGFVNMQEMIIGFNSTAAEQAKFPAPSQRNAQNSGQDLLGDGEYVDPGDTLPLPDAAPAEFYGKHQSYVLQGSTQNILDYSVTPFGKTVGVTLSYGVTLDTNGAPKGPSLRPMYRTFVSSGLPLNFSSPTNAMMAFGQTAYPRWVSIFQAMQIQVNGTLTTLTVALVSLEPDANGLQELAVIDISLPEQPKLLNKIPVSTSLLGGSMESLSLRPDGLLQLAGDQNAVLLNPTYLAVTNVPSGQQPPAIQGFIAGAGTGSRSLGIGNGGVYAVANGAGGTVVQAAPQMRFVSFPNITPFTVVDATTLSGMSQAAVDQLIAGMLVASGALAPARFQVETDLNIPSALEPPNPALHYHVLLTTPGGAGPAIELGLESLNPAGFPLSNPGHSFPPVRAESATTQTLIGQTPRPNCGAPITSLWAYRMSKDTNSPYYNSYLSQPFALITEVASLDDLARLTTEVPRQILLSGNSLRAFIEPDEITNLVVGPFAAQIDSARQVVYPIASVSAFSVNQGYLLGDNPPPPGASTPMEDTFGVIQAHSGEVRSREVDVMLPSPHMQITIVRTIGNQDNYEGPFGVGWDFNYNQRLTLLDPLTFPQGLQMPLVARDTLANSEIAGSQDVLFNNGEGQIYHFLWADTNMPSVYSNDPLVAQLDYADRVSDYYVPQHGTFDLLVRFKDGGFQRLTPDGLLFQYAPNGRLEKITDRFPANHHDLQYDSGGRLVRIDDNSVSAPRYLLFGYFRRQGTDPDFTVGLDANTADSFLEGKIWRIVDYAGRDVQYQYSSDGFLTNRMGIQVSGENGGFAGRTQTYYVYTGCQLSGVLVGQKGLPLVSAINAAGNNGKPVATATTGSHGNDKLAINVNNSAKTLASQTTAVTMADGNTVQRNFDPRGYVTQTTVTGPQSAPVSEITSNTVDGLPYFIVHPEGNSETTTYDTGNPVLRSRGNVLSVKVNPGPRGGKGYTETFQYDPRFNLPILHVNADGFTINYTLTPDGTSVQSITYETAGTQTFTYNSNGQLTDKVDEDGIESSTTYDSSTGFPTTTSRGGLGGITVTYSYDGSIPSQLGRPASMAQALGLPTTLLYNNLLQTVEVDRGPYVTTTAYDELGRGTFHQEQVGDGEQWATSVGYNQLGFITNAVMSGIEIDGSLGSVSYTYTPDKRMRVASVLYPNGTVLTNTYDSRGNRITSTLGDYTEKYGYDGNNNVISQTEGGSLVMTWGYDGLDRPTNVTYLTETQSYAFNSTYYPGNELQSSTITDPFYGVLKYETVDAIDALGRPLSVTEHGTTISPQFQYSHGVLSSSVTGPRMTASTTWNSAGIRTGSLSPLVKLTIKTDDNARVTETDEQEDAATFTHNYTYDDLDHQTSLSDSLGPMFAYAPRADGNEDSITDANNNKTTLAHTSLGELLQRQRADGMTTVYKHDTERRVVFEGDPSAGFNYGFDYDLRLTNSTLRNGASFIYGQFDPRNMPRSITLPGGGSETLAYDLLKRLLQRKISFLSTAWEEDFAYDAEGRERVETYIQNGGNRNTTTYDYDEAGPLLAAHYNEDGASFSVTNTYYPDAGRQSVIYPSGVTVTETRDTATRLTQVSDANGNIISASSWQGTFLPKVVQLGSSMQIVNTYDARGRLTGSRVTRLNTGAVLVHMRYKYDAANNVQVRQYIHRGGKADVMGFDAGERLAREQVGMFLTNSGGFGPSLYQRQFFYHATGLDYLTAVTAAGPLATPPAFATNWSAHDDFLLPEVVDGFSRSADPMGNVAQAQLWVRPPGASAPQAVSAALLHDGLGHLVSVTRADGVSITNEYQPSGLRFSRQVSQGGLLASYSAYVYDDSARLIEEYDRTGSQPALIARYYYASGDSPVAGDLWDPASGKLKRYYFIRDVSQSVIAVADASGNVVERAWYDAYGQPAIELPDTQAPALQSVMAGSSNALLVVLSEPVVKPLADPGPGGGVLAIQLPSAASLLSVSVSTSSIPGTTVLLPSVPGAPPYSVLQFTPTQPSPLSGSVTLTLGAGSLADEWGNLNPQATASFQITNNQPGTVYFTAQLATNSAPTQTARSSVGSSFLFHGQYFDYDTGLVYLRTRFYDPFSGMFLERDPLGYEDSVNHYAGMDNNPATVRDPTGLRGRRDFVARAVARKGGTREEAYAGRAVHAEGVDEQVLAARSTVREQLIREGMGDHNQTALVAALREMLPRSHQGTIEIALKHQNNPMLVRYLVNEGLRQKAEWIFKKSIRGALRTGEGTYAADVDGLWIKVDGVLLDYEQTKRVCDRANEITKNLGETFSRSRQDGDKGFARMWEKASNMFKHGFSANLMEEIGLAHYHGNGETRGQKWIKEELQAKVKKVPDGFTITLRGTYDNFTLDPVKNVSRDDVKGVFAEGLKRFHEKLDWKSPQFDGDLYARVMGELQKGNFDIDHHPIGNGQIGLK